jgi:hypothetical protein
MSHAAPTLPRPTSDDVAALLRARTKDLYGNELGVFNANTRPTDAEVEQLISMSYAEVLGHVGGDVFYPCAQPGTALVALRAAMWVELSYFPEQVRSDRSVYSELVAQWSEGLDALMVCVRDNSDDDGTNRTYAFGTLDVHGWTASPYYGVPPEPVVPVVQPIAELDEPA